MHMCVRYKLSRRKQLVEEYWLRRIRPDRCHAAVQQVVRNALVNSNPTSSRMVRAVEISLLGSQERHTPRTLPGAARGDSWIDSRKDDRSAVTSFASFDFATQRSVQRTSIGPWRAGWCGDVSIRRACSPAGGHRGAPLPEYARQISGTTEPLDSQFLFGVLLNIVPE